MEKLIKSVIAGIAATFFESVIDGRAFSTPSERIEHYGIRLLLYCVVFGIGFFLSGKKESK